MPSDEGKEAQREGEPNSYVVEIEQERNKDEWLAVVATMSSGLAKIKFFESKREIPFISDDKIASEDLEFAQVLRQGESAVYWLAEHPKDELNEIHALITKVYPDAAKILIKKQSAS